MGSKSASSAVCAGNIDSASIYDTHAQIKKLVESYKDLNLKVSKITVEVNENWVGKGRNEF